MYWKHLKTTLLHKWYVFIAGRRLRVPFWRLFRHDLGKLTPAEFGSYGQFHGDRSDPDGFAFAWLDHQNRNDHHWEFWVGRSSHVKGGRHGPMSMPMPAVREMVADWFAAGKVYAGAWPDPLNFAWYVQNKGRMQLHRDTQMRIELVLVEAATWSWI
jgi:hypothetical protein